ncbi:cytochrome C oxidase subunit II [Paenibacillus abyssi]|uniref:Cytochrome C oxidase subunit II n=1 Tax=Paenibacillus abyssi TaxID=1340531 RepID=A0A917CV77_9BACL|nr:cytochrome C oxidase subunit II [Paenibacillus abyssi]GGF99455.1 hypothetical protein GCM10010916_15930 [Paenibacillus abyssi]
MKKKLWLLTAAMALVLVLAACGATENNNTDASNTNAANETGQTNEAGAAGGTELTIAAKNFEFDQTEYRIKKGEPVTINLINNQGVHGIAIANTDYKIQAGDPQTITIDDAGEYQIICSIPCGVGHTKMVSTLIVE